MIQCKDMVTTELVAISSSCHLRLTLKE